MRKTRIGFFLVIILLSNFILTFKAKAQSPSGLKILTLNFNAETDNQVLRQKRQSILENYITQNSIDVIFIPECWSLHNKTNAQMLAADLNMDGIYHMENGVSGVWITSLCMITKKSLHLRNPSYFKLPHSAVTFGNGQTTWLSLGEVNMLVGATITLNNKTAYLWTSHLTDISNSGRIDQIKFAAQQMMNMAKANGDDWDQAWTIFGGDFNTTPETPEIAYLLNDLNFKDPWPMAHPGDAGRTFVAEVADPEYNPLTHASGLFPSQAGYQETGRFDYLLVHGPGAFSAGVSRVFTSPVNNVWMSDHYGLYAEFDFGGETVTSLPSADSDMASLGQPTTFNLTDDVLKSLPKQQNFDVTSLRGFTLTDQPDVGELFSFTKGGAAVYPASHAALGKGDIISFAFFSCGQFKYDLETIDYRDKDGNIDLTVDPKLKSMSGTITVH